MIDYNMLSTKIIEFFVQKKDFTLKNKVQTGLYPVESFLEEEYLLCLHL